MNLVEENEINTHRSRIARTFASAEAGYTILKGLRLSTVFNVDYINTNEFRYFSPESADGRSPNGQGDFYRVENLTYNSNTRLNYAAKFGEHSVDVLAAYEIHNWDKDYASAEAKNYATDKKNVLNVASTPVEIGNYISGDAMLSCSVPTTTTRHATISRQVSVATVRHVCIPTTDGRTSGLYLAHGASRMRSSSSRARTGSPTARYDSATASTAISRRRSIRTTECMT